MSVDLERRAQQAAEQRLAYASAQLYADELGEDEDPEDMPEAGGPTAGPYCGCDTCIVREVLDAAWPFLLELAREEVRMDAELGA